MDMVADQLEKEGVKKFIEPFDKLQASIEERRIKLKGAVVGEAPAPRPPTASRHPRGGDQFCDSKVTSSAGSHRLRR